MEVSKTKEKTRRRLAVACSVVGAIDMLLLLLLLLLPYDCGGGGRETVVIRERVSTDTVVVHDTIVERDSMNRNIDQAVSDAGGNVDGFMRFSITWNQDSHDRVDLDAHATEPGGTEIYFKTYKKPRKTSAGGQLDVDKIRPRRTGVENIYWQDASLLPNGDYRFFIVNYDGGNNGNCDVKLKVGDQSFVYRVSNIKKGSPVTIATVTIANHKMSNIQHSAPRVE